MKRRRSKLEVYLDVLWTIKNGTRKPTRIMYESNLSWKPLQRTLDSLRPPRQADIHLLRAHPEG